MSDVGGVQSIITSFLAIMVGFCNHLHFETFLASRIYKIKRSNASEADNFKSTRLGNHREYCLGKFGCCPKLKMCRKNRHLRGIEKARRLMEKETNIVDLIKSVRCVKEGMRRLVPNLKRQECER
jgi:hypothetical protein